MLSNLSLFALALAKVGLMTGLLPALALWLPLRKVWWKLLGNRLLMAKLDRMTLPQLNLLEARMRASDCWDEGLDRFFDELREEKRAA